MLNQTLTIPAQPLTLRHISKQFEGITVLQDISLEIERGELVCLLGPSGCGKTTLLRIIAGLESQDSGEIWLGLRDISRIHPSARNYGILFQSYALFPNLTVEQNIAYSLTAKALFREQVKARVAEMLDLVGLSHLAKKFPGQISGGQQQRVGLARALAPSPSMLLLDEPMSALDAKVREHLRIELRELIKRLGITTVMVTHDQEEAMMMADRIAVMHKGRIEQFATPETVYKRPQNATVADFIGQANWISPTTEHPFSQQSAQHLFWRPESIIVTSQAGDTDSHLVSISEALFLGNRVRLTLNVMNYPNIELTADVPAMVATEFQKGQSAWVHIPASEIRHFPEAS